MAPRRDGRQPWQIPPSELREPERTGYTPPVGPGSQSVASTEGVRDYRDLPPGLLRIMTR